MNRTLRQQTPVANFPLAYQTGIETQHYHHARRVRDVQRSIITATTGISRHKAGVLEFASQKILAFQVHHSRHQREEIGDLSRVVRGDINHSSLEVATGHLSRVVKGDINRRMGVEIGSQHHQHKEDICLKFARTTSAVGALGILFALLIPDSQTPSLAQMKTAYINKKHAIAASTVFLQDLDVLVPDAQGSASKPCVVDSFQKRFRPILRRSYTSYSTGSRFLNIPMKSLGVPCNLLILSLF
jgi:hypothetical protein